MQLDHNKKLSCCGDEPCHQINEAYIQNSDWLLHEDACQLAQSLNIQNLLLYHTEDKNIKQRHALYMKEAKQYFQGNIWIPDDLDIINIQ